MPKTDLTDFKAVDLSILEKKPEIDQTAVLEILPLAPLSMVTELPGSYYKTGISPNKKMLCGLMENILGWHFDIADRKEIVRHVKKIRKKQDLVFPETSGSSYTPLLLEYFEVNLEVIPKLLHYDDYWSKAYRRADAKVHPKGTFNLSFEIIPKKRELPRDEKKLFQVTDEALEAFFKAHLGKYPLYYSTPTKREFISASGQYLFKLSIDNHLLTLLINAVQEFNVAYLGTSEGWVDVNIQRV